jgi:hypothetical protein
MSKRTDRIQNFNNFRENAKAFFQKLADNEKRNERLNSLYSLCITPGGRYGGNNNKIIEVFYGNRPIGSIEEIDKNFKTFTKYETAHGAALLYFLTDNGNVICNLYPAKSENQQPKEESIILDYIKDPSKLEKKAKDHWNMFIAYMEVTSLDGEPNFLQKIRVFYLRNFKETIENKKVQTIKFYNLLKKLSIYVLTVGLSGFLILLFTLLKDNFDSEKSNQYYEKLYDKIDTSNKALVEIKTSIDDLIIIEKEILSNGKMIKSNLKENKIKCIHIENNSSEVQRYNKTLERNSLP